MNSGRLVGGIQVTTDFKAFTNMFQLLNRHNFIMVLSRAINFSLASGDLLLASDQIQDRVIKLYKGCIYFNHTFGKTDLTLRNTR